MASRAELAGDDNRDAFRPRDRSMHRGANERLYEAYSDLHCLAQDFQKPFDA